MPTMIDPGSRLTAALAALALAVPAAAEEPPAAVTVDWTVDGLVTGGALALWIGSEAAKDTLAPASCRWCTAPGFDVTVRDAVAWSNPRSAATASNLLVAAVPAGVVLYDAVAVGGTHQALPDLLIIGEAVALSGVVTQATKFVAARTRPYAVYGTLPSEGVDDHLSFFSAHTSIAFSAVAAGGMLAKLRGDPAWPWVYGVGFTAAAATGYFRLAADKHWLSDVLMGAATGTAVGLAVPWLHRNRSDPSSVRLAVAPANVGISGTF
jgi:membrane-associated phospholipid phosphatase